MADQSRSRGWATASPWLTLPALILVASVLIYPLIYGASRSVTDQDGGVNPYSWFFDNSIYIKILVRTFVTALSVTLICLALAYPYAYLMTLVGRRLRVIMLLVVLLPFWTSALVRVFAWVLLLQPNGIVADVLAPLGVTRQLLGTQLGVLIGMAQLLLPFMLIPVYSTMNGIDRGLLRAAESLGARPSVAFFRIFVPLSKPGVVAGSFLVFMMSLGFYIVPALLGSPTESLIAQTIYQQVSSLLYFGRGGALGIILIISTSLILGLVMLVALIARRTAKVARHVS